MCVKVPEYKLKHILSKLHIKFLSTATKQKRNCMRNALLIYGELYLLLIP